MWDGTQWPQLSFDAKVGYVKGVGNLADFEAAASKGKAACLSQAFAAELKTKTVHQIIDDVDKFYKDNPEQAEHLGAGSDLDALHHGVPAGDGGGS